MTVKERIYRIVERLPEDRLEEAERFLYALSEDPVSYTDVIDGLIREIPHEELDKLPTDLSDNLDYYAYGKPKT